MMNRDAKAASADLESINGAGGKKSQSIVFNDGILAGTSTAIEKLRHDLHNVAQQDGPVLITGPDGCGKRILVRTLHQQSNRRDHPFVPLNIAALGREYSARVFSKRALPTYLAAVGEGTLSLDDVADLGPNSQTILEEVLIDGVYTSLNDDVREKFKARLICLTSSDIMSMVSLNRFKRRLYNEISVHKLRMPSLTERLDDIPVLVPFLIKGHLDKGLPDRRFAPSAIAALQDYGWPGNLRELDSILQILLLLTKEDDVINGHVVHQVLKGHMKGENVQVMQPLVEKYTQSISKGPAVPKLILEANMQDHSLSQSVAQHLDHYFKAHHDMLPPVGLYDRILSEVERPLIEKCLHACKGSQLKAARLLGINRNTLRKKIQLLGLQSRSKDD